MKERSKEEQKYRRGFKKLRDKKFTMRNKNKKEK